MPQRLPHRVALVEYKGAKMSGQVADATEPASQGGTCGVQRSKDVRASRRCHRACLTGWHLWSTKEQRCQGKSQMPQRLPHRVTLVEYKGAKMSGQVTDATAPASQGGTCGVQRSKDVRASHRCHSACLTGWHLWSTKE